MFRTAEIIFAIIGLLAVFASDRLSMPDLIYVGIVAFGFMALTIGSEAIVTREIVVGSRRRGNRQTYTGLPAMLQGIQFNLLGIFLIGISAFMYLTDGSGGREIFLQFVRRPGIPLVVLGVLFLMQAAIVLVGSHELRLGARWVVILNLLVSRLLPGVILVVLGVGALGLGLFEITAPNAFDEMGGGFLEVLYGVR